MNKEQALDAIIKLLKKAEREHYSGQGEKSNQTITELIEIITDQYEKQKERERKKCTTAKTSPQNKPLKKSKE